MVLAKTTISLEALKFAGPILTDILFTFCKFSFAMNLLNSTIKLLHRSLSNCFIKNLSESILLFFLYPKPNELSVLWITNVG